MRRNLKYFLVCLCFGLLTFGCSSSTNNPSAGEQKVHSLSDGEDYYVTFSDGEYCATVKYDNPRTGHEGNYSLTVEVEDGRLAVIQWSNGGVLDESHFDPPKLNDEGDCRFVSDRGIEYSVHINEDGSCD